MINLILTGLLLLTVSTAQAAITLDNSTAFGDGGSGNSQSGSLSIAADANLVIVCLAERDTNSSNFTASTATVTIGGVSATQVIGSQTSDNLVRSVMFRLLSPPTGSVTVSATGDTGSELLAVGVMSFKGVVQTGTFNTAASNSNTGSTNADIDGLLSATGEMGVMCGTVRANTSTPSPDATAPASTEVFDYVTTGGAVFIRVFGYIEDGDTASINMRVDLSGSERWAATGVSIRPIVASTSRHRRAVMLP